jgi:hypothetical protein
MFTLNKHGIWYEINAFIGMLFTKCGMYISMVFTIWFFGAKKNRLTGLGGFSGAKQITKFGRET